MFPHKQRAAWSLRRIYFSQSETRINRATEVKSLFRAGVLGSSLPCHINPACSHHSCPARAGNLGTQRGSSKKGLEILNSKGPNGNSPWLWFLRCSFHFKKDCKAISGYFKAVLRVEMCFSVSWWRVGRDVQVLCGTARFLVSGEGLNLEGLSKPSLGKLSPAISSLLGHLLPLLRMFPKAAVPALV